MRSRLRPRGFAALASSLAALAVLSSSGVARADASGWLFVGGGALAWKQGSGTVGQAQYDGRLGGNGTMTFDVGAGTSPDKPFIVGTFARIQPIFKNGTDLGLMVRGASHGFQVGSLGFALDAGTFFRTWGTKAWGFSGGLNLGVPLGITLGLQAQVGTNNSVGFGAVAGIDVLRLTVFRRALTDRWPNTSPDYRPSLAPPVASGGPEGTGRF